MDKFLVFCIEVYDVLLGVIWGVWYDMGGEDFKKWFFVGRVWVLVGLVGFKVN